MARISIISRTRTLRDAYVLHALCDIWREAGHEIVVAPRCHPEADVGLLHINRTRIRQDQVGRIPTGLTVINGAVRDIAKRRISSLLVGPDDDWDGPVIVKTDLNAFGRPERQDRRIGRTERLRERLAAILPWQWARRLPPLTYPVLPHRRRVPGWVWRNASLVVERFMPEREGDLYALRGWVFLGERGYGYRMLSTHPLVKTGTMVRHDYIDRPPPELEETRRRLGFDYGKFDYVMHDGTPILLDANKTPFLRGDRRSPRIVALAEGLRDYLP